MVHEGEGVIPRQGREPKRHLGEVDCNRVAVDAVKAALGHEATGVDDLVLVARDLWPRVMGSPGIDQHVSKLAAGLQPLRGGGPGSGATWCA